MSETLSLNEVYEFMSLDDTFTTCTGDFVTLGEPENQSTYIDDVSTVRSRIGDFGGLTNPFCQLNDD